MMFSLENLAISFTKQGDVVWIESSFRDKDEVKAWGARWDPDHKSWWFSWKTFCLLFPYLDHKYEFKDSAEIPDTSFFDDKETYFLTEHPIIFQYDEEEDTLDAVHAHYNYKDELKSLGFWWSAEKKCWYHQDKEDFLFFVMIRLSKLIRINKNPNSTFFWEKNLTIKTKKNILF